MRAGVMLILDGLGDRPIAALGGRTPLEAAHTPVLDGLAARGVCGLVDPLAPGERVCTHVGVGALMGLATDDARRLQRGPVEAAGVGLPVAAGDVAWRCNLATLEDRGGVLHVLDRRAGRESDGNSELCAALDGLRLDGVKITLRPATGHRAVLVMSGPGLSPAVRDADPGDAAELPAMVPACRAADAGDAAAERTAGMLARVLRVAFERLDAHPVNRARRAHGLLPSNGLIARGAGAVFGLENRIRDAGLRACVITAECTVRGLARLFGFALVDSPTFTADTDTDLDGKIASARAALTENDLVFVHVKGTDLCAHDRRPDDKRAFIERVDSALAPLVDAGVPIAVTADHSTDSNTGAHVPEPVPSLLYWPGIAPGPPVPFGENGCLAGSLGRMSAADFLRRFADLD